MSANEQSLHYHFVVQPAGTDLLIHIRGDSRSRKPAIWLSMDGAKDLRGIEPLATRVYPVEDFAQSTLVGLFRDCGGNGQSVESTRDVLDRLGIGRYVGALPQPLEHSPEIEEIGRWNY